MDMADVGVCTATGFTKCVGALVYRVDPENEECKIAYLNLLFGHSTIDGRDIMCSVLTPAIGNNQDMGDVEYGRIYDVFFPPEFLRLFRPVLRHHGHDERGRLRHR